MAKTQDTRGPERLLQQTPTTKVTTRLQGSVLIVQTDVEDQEIRDKVQANRNAQLIVPGRNAAPLHPEGARIVYWFQCHAVKWRRIKRKHPDIFADLNSGDQLRREKAAAFLAKKYPQYTNTAPLELRPATKQRTP